MGNGLNTRCWWDLWSPLNRPLITFVDKNHHLLNPCVSVEDFVLPSGFWNINAWKCFLPDWVVNKICSIPPPYSTNEDSYCWRPSADGRFSVKSAYKFIYHNSAPVGEPIWKKIWKWQIPEKIKFFLWQALHERLNTNLLKANLGLSPTSECPFECHSEESVIHIIRDCQIAQDFWKHLISTNHYSSFFQCNLQV